MDEREELERLRVQVHQLRGDLSRVTRELDEAQYEIDVIRWMVRGVASASVSLRVDPAMLANASVQELLTAFGRHAARCLLQESKLAFNDHAEMYALKAHVRYLENHARVNGLEFTPYALEETDALPQQLFRPHFYCRYSGERDGWGR